MLHQQSYRSLRQQYASRSLSPADVIASALAHAADLDAKLNLLAWLDTDGAAAAAQASERRWASAKPLGPLDGMPLTVKEFAAIQGWPTRKGSLTLPETPAAASTVFVQRLQDAGAIILGKTRAPEFNWKGVTDSPGFGITHNPWDPRLTPGGSSGGCAAAVAGGLVRVSLGSDAGGSIRIPAAFTGTLGLKPTYGRIPQKPLPSAFSSIVHTGPIGLDAIDMLEVLRVVSGPDAADWGSYLGSPLDGQIPASSTASLRIGLLAPKYWHKCDTSVKDAMHAVLDRLDGMGMAVTELDLDIEAASQVGAYFYRVGCAASVAAVAPEMRRLLDPGLVEFAASAADSPLSEYLHFCQQRDLQAGNMAAAFEHVDFLMLPTLPILAFEAGRLVPAGWPSSDWMSWNPYTPAFNIAQLPAMSYPIWPQGGRLPAGVQFVAPKFGECRLLDLARKLQEYFPIRAASA